MDRTRSPRVSRDATWWIIEAISALVSAWLAAAEALSTPSQRQRARRTRVQWREIRREHHLRLARIESSNPTELPQVIEELLGHPDWSSTQLASETRSKLRRLNEDDEALRAIAAATHGDAVTAADAFRAYLAAHPDSSLVRVRLARELERLGDLEGSIDVHRDTRRRAATPNLRTFSSVEIGRLHTLRGEHAESVAELRGVLAAADERLLRPLAYFYLGQALNALGDLPGARHAWKQAARLDRSGALRSEARKLIAESVRPR